MISSLPCLPSGFDPPTGKVALEVDASHIAKGKWFTLDDLRKCIADEARQKKLSDYNEIRILGHR
jgi:hypothetical protein|tara:strand:- start:270 stop:464 length:195 start_codon:yes stop_codon:yes gene_type:complete